MRRILMFVPILAALMIVLTPGQALADPPQETQSGTGGLLTSLGHLGEAEDPAIAAHFALIFPDGTVADTVGSVTPVGP